MEEKTAADLKRQLKKWENDFKEKHGRKPNKDDISGAGDDVQGQYKQYYKLTRTLKTVDVWGAELNRGATKETCASEDRDVKTPSSSIGKKLWENSKRIPTSFQKLRLKPSIANNISHDENKDGGIPNGTEVSPDGLWRKEDTPRPQGIKPRFSLSADPLPLTPCFSSPLPKTNKTKDTTPPNADDECVLQPKKGSVFEKALLLTKSNKKHGTLPKDKEDVYLPIAKKSQLSSFKNINSDFLDQVQEGFEEIRKPHSSAVYSAPVTAVHMSSHDTSSTSTSNQLPHSPEKRNHSVRDYHGEKDVPYDVESKPQGVNERRGSKRKVSASPPRSEETFGDMDSFLGDDPFREPLDVPMPKANKRARPESFAKGMSIIKDGNIEPRHVPQVTLKPREVEDFRQSDQEGAPSSTATCGEGEDASSVHEEKKSKPKKSRANALGPSKSVGGGGGGAGMSQNFVRLNMKVKTYRRRGGGRTGGQIKRMQWKQKMAARAQSRGSSCFKCGEEGHWAKNCKGKRKKESEAVEDDTPPPPENFPSLGDAMRMARGKPQQRQKPTSTSTEMASDIDDPGAVNAEAPSTGEQEDQSDDLMEELEKVRQLQAEREGDVKPMPSTEPLFQLSDDGQVPEAPPAVYKALATFGYKTFRPGQEAAIMRILCGQTTLVQLSTGAGKSLCYQLPALMYAQRSRCITLVISPLVSLMEDQVTGLPAGLNGACLHTNMTKPQRQKVVDSVEDGHVHFLLLSPEALISTGAGILNFSKVPPIAFACIDEAHCVSSWSHNFRPSYLRVCKVLRDKLGVRCLLGLTATATRATALNVAEHIGVEGGEDAFIRGKVVPPNLVLSVSRDEDRDRALLQLVQGERFSSCHSIIIYCTRRQTTERLATMIRTNLRDVKHTVKINKDAPKSKSKKVIQSTEAYHAGLSAAGRKRVQLNFMNGSLRIVVATVAFGMGLDKQDVHGIIHYNLPRNFESYVQEIGRAGRDGNTSHCHVFLDEQGTDMRELKRHIFADTVDRFTVKKFIQRFFPRCRCDELQKRFQNIQEDDNAADTVGPDTCPGHERAVVIDKLVNELDMKEEGISTLLCYLELDEGRYVEIMNSIYATCTLTSHSGLQGFSTAANKCPALAVAIARAKMRGEYLDGRQFTFPVVDVADNLGTTSGVVKREISGLKWIQTALGGYQRSSLLIEFSDLAYHVRSRGNLTDDEIDQLVDLLHGRICDQEENELHHLHYFYNILHSVAHRNFYMCADEADLDRSGRLKNNIRKYFDFNQVHLPTDEVNSVSSSIEQPPVNEDSVCADVRQFIHLYSDEHTLTARCITRIFHGIASPNFPADVWGRVRRFWRCHLDVDFNLLLHLAKRTLISMK